MRQRDIEIFWSKVEKTNGCWKYNGAKDRDGYHAHSYIANGKRIKTGAHRFMMMVNGHTIPKDYVVCHHCDNPSCVNPNHLFIGTVKDNNDDKVRKGRQTKLLGSKNPLSKLDEATAKKIKAEAVVGSRVGYNNGSNIKTVAKKYGVHIETVRLIANGKTWKHI